MLVRPKVGEAVIRLDSPRGLPSGRLPDPERNEREAVRRAQGMIRRVVVEHDLTRMWTLTLKRSTTASDRREVVHLVQLFIKRLRRRWHQVKWLAVLEWHPGGHGWHVHLVVNRWLPKAVMQELWPHGFIDARLIRPKGERTGKAAARKAGQYVAKYLGKSQGEHEQPAHQRGEQRYLRAEGLDVTEVHAEGSFLELCSVAEGWWPEGIGWRWASGTDPEWRGPPVVVYRSR